MTNVKAQNLESIYSYLKQAGISASATSSGDNFVNTIWNTVEDVKTVKNGDDEEKTRGIKNIIKKVINLVAKLVKLNNEKSEAANETKGNANDAQDVNEETEAIKTEIKAETERISAELGDHIALIEGSIEIVTKNATTLRDTLVQLKTIQEQIEVKKQELAKADKKADQEKILGEIQALAGQVPSIASTIATIQESLATESENIAKAYTAVEVLKGNAVDVQTNGQEEIIAITSKANEEVVENTESIATGTGENIPTSAQASAAGTAASTNVLTATQAPKLFATAADEGAAATTRITGGTGNLGELFTAFGSLGETGNALGEFGSSIEETLGNFDTAIGKWNEIVNPMITSIGSLKIEDAIAASEELTAIAEEDKKNTVDVTVSKEQKEANTAISDGSRFQTINFETKKLSFGI